MTAEVEYVKFFLSDNEIKAINKFRKEHKHEDSFELKLTPTGISDVVQIRPRRLPGQIEISWSNVTDYESW